MPQLTLKYCTIADVSIVDGGGKTDRQGNKMDKIVKINVDEEDFFEMLDHVNPKNIIKYLDMRGIPHRDALNVTVKTIDVDSLKAVYPTMRKKALKKLYALETRNTKKILRNRELMPQYNGKVTLNIDL